MAHQDGCFLDWLIGVVAHRFGIPKALTTHSLFPLYSAFLSNLGLEVVLSGVDPRGDLKAFSSFCFPVQILHGAVLDLVHQNVNLVFLPHVIRMPHRDTCRDCYLCPVTQASPYFLAKAFPDVRFLSPLLDFTDGYEGSPALVAMAVAELGIDRQQAEAAWTAAVLAQSDAERAMQDLGQRALEQVVADGQPAILLAGPFNCLPFRISEAILKPQSIQRGMPILTYESDGYAVSPSFLRQVDVHIQQVLDHAAGHRVTHRGTLGSVTDRLRGAVDQFVEFANAKMFGPDIPDGPIDGAPPGATVDQELYQIAAPGWDQ